MTPTAGRPGSGPSAPDPRRASPAAHEHAWATMEFQLVDDHPVVRQRCGTCGLVRRYRAWERYWSPAPASGR